MRKPFALLLSLSILGTAGAGFIPSRAHAEIIERIVAIVNDEIITQTDLDKYAARLRSGGLTDDLLIADEATKQSLLQDRSKLLDKMIDEKIIDSEIKKQNLSVPIERVEQEIRSIAKRNNVSRDELKSALQERGIDFSQYQDFIKTGLERQALIEKAITSRIKISEDDVLAAYSARKSGSSAQAYEFTLSHILFLNEKGGAEAARARAEEALKKLKDGGNFEKIAAEYSDDPAFENGGLIGVFKSNELNDELKQAVEKLGSGETTDVIPTRGGFQIVRVNKKRLITDPATEKERDQLRAALYEKAYKKQFRSWLDQLHQEAFIRINNK